MRHCAAIGILQRQVSTHHLPTLQHPEQIRNNNISHPLKYRFVLFLCSRANFNNWPYNAQNAEMHFLRQKTPLNLMSLSKMPKLVAFSFLTVKCFGRRMRGGR